MKDKKQNLSNELSDSDVEAVAGGAWTENQLKKLEDYCEYVKWADDENSGRRTCRVLEAANEYDNPAEFVKNAKNTIACDIIEFVKGLC